MHHFLKLFLLGIILIALFSCEEVFNLQVREAPPRLVVEGLITNEDTSYYIKISKTSKYTFTYNTSTIDYETAATVIVSDNTGIIDTLSEISNGIYKTSKIKGEIGRSYQLEIFTTDGMHYKSEPEEMLPTPTIDSLYFSRDFNDHPTYASSYKFYIYVDWKDPTDEENFYLRKCRYYWADTWHDNIEWTLVLNDKYFNGFNLNKYIVSQGYGGSQWWFYLEQYSLSRDAYNFWQILQEQTNNTDNDVTNISAPLYGNIYNADNPDDRLIGYFQVSAKSVASVYINR